MLHYVHQVVSSCVCLLFGAERVMYSGYLISENSLYTAESRCGLLAVGENNTSKVMRVNQNSKVVAWTANQ